MAYLEHWLFVMQGTQGTGADSEVWQCGIRGTWSGVDADAPAWLAGAKTFMTTYFAAAANHMRTDALLTELKFNEIGPDGKYVNPTSNFVTMSVAGGTAPPLPFPDCAAWSWTTVLARGPASSGRIYPPNAFALANGGSSRITAADVTAMALAAANLCEGLSAIATVPGAAFVPCVVSKHGITAPITGVRVGNVIDIQRRRKNALVETYTAHAVT